MTGGVPADATAWMAAFTTAVIDADTSPDPLVDVLRAVCAALPPVEGAALSSTRSGKTVIAAFHGDGAERLETMQRRIGQGPTLQAIRERSFVSSTDLAADARWPKLQAVASRLSARAVLCCPLQHAHPRPVTLTLYGTGPAASGDHLHPDVLSLVLMNTDLALAGLAQHSRARNLDTALNTNERIAVAIGVLVGLHRYTEADAHQALAATSQALNRKLNDIATEVVLTGALPQPPAAPTHDDPTTVPPPTTAIAS